jgi:hypothetical protein
VTPNQFCYQTWSAHRLMPHGIRPTRLHVRIARVLSRWQHRMPSHGKLARAARCCVRTVQNALSRLRGLGLLGWTHQGFTGRWGRRRLPNAYRFDASLPLEVKIQAPNLLLGKLPLRTVEEQLRLLRGG